MYKYDKLFSSSSDEDQLTSGDEHVDPLQREIDRLAADPDPIWGGLGDVGQGTGVSSQGDRKTEDSPGQSARRGRRRSARRRRRRSARPQQQQQQQQQQRKRARPSLGRTAEEHKKAVDNRLDLEVDGLAIGGQGIQEYPPQPLIVLPPREKFDATGIIDEIAAFNFARLGVLIRGLSAQILKGVVWKNTQDGGMVHVFDGEYQSQGFPLDMRQRIEAFREGKAMKNIDGRTYSVEPEDLVSLDSCEWVEQLAMNYYLLLATKAPNALRIGLREINVYRGNVIIPTTEKFSWSLDAYQNFDKILMPVYKGRSHFTLLVVDIGKKEMRYYESLAMERHEEKEGMKIMRSVLAGKEKWKLTYVKNAPQQSDGVNCGVFTARVAVLETFGIEVGENSVPENKLEDYRWLMKYTIAVDRFVG